MQLLIDDLKEIVWNQVAAVCPNKREFLFKYVKSSALGLIAENLLGRHLWPLSI